MPHFTASIKSVSFTAKFILLIEKDTVFKKLVQSDILHGLGAECIIITVQIILFKLIYSIQLIFVVVFFHLQGKGYPDINTRLILKKIWDDHRLPIYAITDGDPHGIEIMLTYRHGSLASKFILQINFKQIILIGSNTNLKNISSALIKTTKLFFLQAMSNISDSLAVPSIQWLGILPSDITKFGIKSIPLTGEDTRKLDNLLKRPHISNEVYNELLLLKRTNMKAEIEGLSESSSTYLMDIYLRNKFNDKIAI